MKKKHYKDIRIKELRRAADRYKQNQIKNYKTNINRDSIARVAVTGGLTGAGLYIVGSALKPGSFGSDFLKNVGPEVAVGSAILSSLLYINHDSIEKYGKVRF